MDFFKTRNLSEKKIMSLLKTLAINEFRDLLLIPVGSLVGNCRNLSRIWKSNEITLENHKSMRLGLEIYSHNCKDITSYILDPKLSNSKNSMTHLDRLEAEAIYIMREVVAEANNPVMLYSIGKDSSVMLHLALKAFIQVNLLFHYCI